MTLPEFLEHVSARRPLARPEIYRFMDEMNDRARRITSDINGTYHTQEELRELIARLFGTPVDRSLRVFPPLHTDFGLNIRIGRDVFINAGCHFKDHGGVVIGDGCLIGHNVVFATLDHDFDPAKRAVMHPAPIVLGRNVWIGSHATILRGVILGDNAIVAAGAVVTQNVAADTVVGGVPARPIRKIGTE